MYVVVYQETQDKSSLYEINQDAETFSFTAIPLSENRHLTALVYNVLDKHLLALDANSFELIRINKNGVVESLGVPDNIDKNMFYRAATMYPDGSAMAMLAYDPSQNKNTRIYTINFGRTDLYAGFLGATGPPNIDIADFATDPLTGGIYGFDSNENKLAQLGIGGEITTLFYPDTGDNQIEAVFFNQQGELFGFSPTKGLFAIDKGTGQVRYVFRGPDGTSADGCSCPYTYEFTKRITPKQIVPCEAFTVNYNFSNNLGIGQAWIELRDTFPEGFEIIDISGQAVSDHNIIPGSPKHILALENLIYLMRDNQIEVTVLPSETYQGEFSSQARQLDFPLAFDTMHSSDDPTTDQVNDPTRAEVLKAGSLDFSNQITYSCDGQSAVISSPLIADQYQWSTQSNEACIKIEEPGWYALMASSNCYMFYDSVYIDGFLSEKSVDLGDDLLISLGDSVLLMPIFNRESIAEEIGWFENGVDLGCPNCDSYWAKPIASGEYSILITDEGGCILRDTIQIRVDLGKEIYVPNAFSPNGDGVNETLFISSSVPAQVISFEVYNRWGNLVFYKKEYPISNIENAWDGTWNGSSLGIGSYIWRAELEFIDGDKQAFSGQVMIMSNTVDE